MFHDASRCPGCRRLRDGQNGLRCPTCNHEWTWEPRDAADVAAYVAEQIDEAGGEGPFTIGDIEVSEETFLRYWGLLPLLPPTSTLPSPSPSPKLPVVIVPLRFDPVADEERLAELLVEWEDAADAGRERSPEDLCRECPHLVGRLADRIADLQSIGWLKKSDSQKQAPVSNAWKSAWKRGDVPTAGYTLVKLLGHGSFGEVWSVRGPDEALHALKIVDHPSKSLQEQRGLSRIVDVRHPFVLLIESIRLENEKLMIVTELAEGSLHEVFARRRSHLSSLQENRAQANIHFDSIHHEILRMLRDAAEALDYMREEFSLLHLDVKPTNLVIKNGRCKVGDFGTISRIVSPFDTQFQLSPDALFPPRSVAPPSGDGGTRITNSGAFTHKYAPPEAYRGEFSRTHDQYSLAMTYCELLTGRVPFTGEWDEQVQQRSTHRMNVGILPPKVRLVVTKALSSDPAQRYESCVEFIDSLYINLGATIIDTPLSEIERSENGPNEPLPGFGRNTIECRMPTDVFPEETVSTWTSNGSLSVLFPIVAESVFQETQTHPLSLEQGRCLVIGRQEGGGTEYLHPSFSPTQRLPGSERRIVIDLAHGDDTLVSRGHFALRGAMGGILFINGVPHRSGAIRPPRNGTFLLEPNERPLLPGEELLIAHGTSIKIRLPNNVKVLICADGLGRN